MILTEEELIRWGHRVGKEVDLPVFLGLRGPLGAGKSVLARAVARGAGVKGALPSPTFNLCFQYEGRHGIRVVHMDLYRIASYDELWDLGWAELGSESELVLVEWPERAGDLLPEDRWEVHLSHSGSGVDRRRVEVDRVGEPPHLPGFPVEVTGG